MKNAKSNLEIQCSNCGTTMKVDELITTQFEQSIRKDLEGEIKERMAELDQTKEEYNILSKNLLKEKEDVDEIVNSRVKSLLQTKEDALKNSIREELNEEKAIQLQELENELVKKSKQLRELNGTKAQLQRLQREMEEAETRIIMEKEQELTERLEQARSTIKEQVQQESFLKLKEREKVIEDLKNKLDEAKRKAEQGSMQLQGDVQELQIIDALKSIHQNDEITQSKKGANGADVLQIVKTLSGAECGKIYYESKRTNSWSNEWVKKFKQDNLNMKADILVIVTNALPKGMKRYGVIEDVWVCNFADVKELSLVLRYGLLKLQAVAMTQHDKANKMEVLYKYLTSEEFKNVFEAILGGFKAIQESHQNERLKISRLWKEREKVLEQVLSNTVEFYGSIKGIAAEVPEVKMLEFYRQAS